MVVVSIEVAVTLSCINVALIVVIVEQALVDNKAIHGGYSNLVRFLNEHHHTFHGIAGLSQ